MPVMSDCNTSSIGIVSLNRAPLSATNSASELDRDTTFCRLLDHDNKAKLAGLSTPNTYPLVEREVSIQPAKSESQ